MHYPFFLWNRRCRRDQNLWAILTTVSVRLRKEKGYTAFFQAPPRSDKIASALPPPDSNTPGADRVATGVSRSIARNPSPPGFSRSGGPWTLAKPLRQYHNALEAVRFGRLPLTMAAAAALACGGSDTRLARRILEDHRRKTSDRPLPGSQIVRLALFAPAGGATGTLEISRIPVASGNDGLRQAPQRSAASREAKRISPTWTASRASSRSLCSPSSLPTRTSGGAPGFSTTGSARSSPWDPQTSVGSRSVSRPSAAIPSS